jgi:hypothetical protein
MALAQLKRSLIGDVQQADACGFWRYAGFMRYGQGGGLTAEGRRRRELVRLEAVKRFKQRAPTAVTPVGQNRIVSTVRNTEVVSDSTNALAVEAAAQPAEDRPGRSGGLSAPAARADVGSRGSCPLPAVRPGIQRTGQRLGAH